MDDAVRRAGCWRWSGRSPDDPMTNCPRRPTVGCTLSYEPMFYSVESYYGGVYENMRIRIPLKRGLGCVQINHVHCSLISGGFRKQPERVNTTKS